MDPQKMPSPEEIQAIYAQGEAVVRALLMEQAQQIRRLEARIQALEEQLGKNSQNSGKPPSSDGLKKPSPKSLRKASGKRGGGQTGHVGYRLEPVARPDAIEVHDVRECAHCQADLANIEVARVEKRQVFDLPLVRLAVTEHQAEVKPCPVCGRETQAAFPSGVEQPTQYGPRIRAQMVYFHAGQFIPLARTAEIMVGLYGQAVSEGTIVKAVSEAAQRVEPVVAALRAYLVQTPEAVHFDESGARVNGRLHWVHSASTLQVTVLGIHPKRGREGMDAQGILPQRQGWCVHDGLKAYAHYAVRHALCNAHHLRELTFIADQYGQQWAVQLRHALTHMHHSVEAMRASGRAALYPEQVARFNDQYSVLLAEATLEIGPPPPPLPGHRPKHSSPTNLLKRLRDGRSQVLAFIHDFAVPFDNNLAERDIRMLKVQQKVSGGFRQLSAAQAFCTLRSYLSTARKNAQAALSVLFQAFAGQPYSPPCLLPPPSEASHS